MSAQDDRFWRRVGAALAATAVGLGAFGAHALGAHPRIETWHTASHYHLLHAIALCVPGLPGWPRRLLLAGTLVFAGSLYLLVLSDQRWLGAITPIGGVVLIVGWVLAAASKT